MKKKLLAMLATIVCMINLTGSALALEIPDEIRELLGKTPSGNVEWTLETSPDGKLSLSIPKGFEWPAEGGTITFPSRPESAPAVSEAAAKPSFSPSGSMNNFQKSNTYRSGVFADVSDQDWFSANVRTVYEYGLMNGGDGKFSPRNNVTLAQILAITCRLHSIYATGAADFTQGSPWYQVYLDYAEQNGITGATGKADYNVPATRREVAGMLAWSIPDALTAKNSIVDGAVPDVASGSPCYNEIYALYRAGIVAGGSKDHAFNPDAQISRAETAAMVARIVDPSLRLDVNLSDSAGGQASVPSPTPNITRPVDSLWKGKTTGGSLPGFKDKATQENVLALLDQYDPDGAFILRKAGLDFMTWFSLGGRTLLERVDTAVHEEYHAISHIRFQDATNYYAGNGILLPVTHTKVYNSKEMISYIPSELRNTFRFNTYVNTDEPNLSSVKQGIYGLMNEFNAYGCGLNNTVALYDFYKAHASSIDDWFQYVSGGANDRLAYAEFRYYILTYLLYAKDKHPDVYQGILNNQEFKDAFNRVERWFTENVQKYEDTLSDLKQRFESAGHRVQAEGDWFRVDGAGTSIFGGDYQMLMNAMSAEKYQAVLTALRG